MTLFAAIRMPRELVFDAGQRHDLGTIARRSRGRWSAPTSGWPMFHMMLDLLDQLNA